jgi:hypothetical protein
MNKPWSGRPALWRAAPTLAKEDLLGAYVKNDRSELTPDHVPVGQLA